MEAEDFNPSPGEEPVIDGAGPGRSEQPEAPLGGNTSPEGYDTDALWNSRDVLGVIISDRRPGKFAALFKRIVQLTRRERDF